MASTQIPQDHQAALDELVKQAQSEAAAKVASNPHWKVAVLGTLKNTTVGSLNLTRTIGEQSKEFPPIITRNAFGIFQQVSEHDIKSAVLYSGGNQTGLQCGWLFAWSNPKDGSPKKVYVDCGLLTKFDNMTWEEIEAKLNKSGDESFHNDPATVTSIVARIESLDGSSHGVLSVVFMS